MIGATGLRARIAAVTSFLGRFPLSVHQLLFRWAIAGVYGCEDEQRSMLNRFLVRLRSMTALRDVPFDSLSRSPIARWAPIPLRLIVGFGFMQHGFAELARGPEAF